MKHFLIKTLLILVVLSVGMFSCKQENILQDEQEMAISTEELVVFKSEFKNDFSKWAIALENTIKVNGYENFKSIENLPTFQAELSKQLSEASNLSGNSSGALKLHKLQTANLSPKVKAYISDIATATKEAFKQFEGIDNSNLDQMTEDITLILINGINKIEQEAETNKNLNEVELLSVIAITVAIKEMAPVLVSTGIEIAKTFLNQNIDLSSAEVRGWFSDLINTAINLVVNNVVAIATFVGNVIGSAYNLGYNILTGNGLNSVWNSTLGLFFTPLNFVLDWSQIYFGNYDCYVNPDLWNCP